MTSPKEEFEVGLKSFVATLRAGISLPNGDWSIKGFIDVFRNVYTISGDTKIVSKVLELHLFPLLLQFAEEKNYKLVLADHQNYYPDITMVSAVDESIKFAVDFKTTYRDPKNANFCNGFTLGSHGEYFTDRSSTKNIQFPYADYDGHFCLGIIYDRNIAGDLDETRMHQIDELESITSVITNIEFFVAEKWKIASDKGGSGNTANIGSIKNIDDIINGRGMFSELGERWFDDYWMNFGKITTTDRAGKTTLIRDLRSFVEFRGGPVERIVPKRGTRG